MWEGKSQFDSKLIQIKEPNLFLPESIYNSHYGNGVPAMFTC